MKSEIRRLRVVSAFMALAACGIAACAGGSGNEPAGETETVSQAEATSAAASSGGTAEGAGEHGDRAEGTTAPGEHSEDGDGGEHAEAGERGEHSGEGGAEHDAGGDEGEEGGVYINRADTWDTTRNGARLVLAFDAASASFKGRVENTTSATLCAVRVEVHLSGGVELGPTDRIDVPSGQSTEIVLATGGASVETWTAHPEVASCSD